MYRLSCVQGLEVTSAFGHSELVLSGTLLEDVLDEGFAGLVGAADEGTAGTVEEAHVEGALSPELECLGRDVFFDLHVALGGTHVLAECNNVDVDLAEFCRKWGLVKIQ